MLGGLALSLAPAGDVLAAPGARRFAILRDGEEVGRHTLAPRETGDGLEMTIDIEIVVTVLGLAVYRYEHRNVELWRDGRLAALDSRTNDDGSSDFCRARRDGDRLQIEGSSFNGDAPGDARPTSYWNYGNLNERWFSSQSGELLDLGFSKGRENGLERWEVTGDVALALYYDGAREWRGCAFDGGGEPMTYRQSAPGADLRALL